MRDLAVEEVRARRRRLLKERYGGSVDRMIQAAIENQRLRSHRVVNLRQRAPAKAVA
jgi:hypothetical protein